MTRTGNLVYRCKACGCLDLVPFDDVDQGVEDNLDSSQGIGSHTCPDGAIGVTELICGRPNAEATP